MILNDSDAKTPLPSFSRYTYRGFERLIGQCSNLLAAYSSTSLPSGRTLTNNRGALFSVWNSSYVAAASSKIVSTSRLLSRGRIRNRSTRCKIRKQDTISDSRGVNSPVVRPVCRLRDAPRLDRPPTDVILFMRDRRPTRQRLRRDRCQCLLREYLSTFSKLSREAFEPVGIPIVRNSAIPFQNPSARALLIQK